jgi:hypothetical protein
MSKTEAEGLTTQSDDSKPLSSQRVWAFILTIIALNITMVLSTRIGAPVDLAREVIAWESTAGIVVVLGRTGVHLAEAWANSRIGTAQAQTPKG